MLQSLLATTDRVVQEIDSVEYGLTDIQVGASAGTQGNLGLSRLMSICITLQYVCWPQTSGALARQCRRGRLVLQQRVDEPHRHPRWGPFAKHSLLDAIFDCMQPAFPECVARSSTAGSIMTWLWV